MTLLLATASKNFTIDKYEKFIFCFNDYKNNQNSIVCWLNCCNDIPFSQMQTADAATLCTDVGADESPRCYGLASYSPNSYPYILDGTYSQTTFVNQSPSNGFLQHSVWVIFDNGDILEAGINDPQGSGAAKFVTAVDGSITKSIGTPSNNQYYGIQVHDSNLDNTWTMAAHTTTDTKYKGSINAYKSQVGSEAVYTNAPNFNIDHNYIYQHIGGSWVLTSSGNSWQGTTTTSGYYLDKCGSGSENYYHINTGKGSVPNC